MPAISSLLVNNVVNTVNADTADNAAQKNERDAFNNLLFNHNGINGNEVLDAKKPTNLKTRKEEPKDVSLVAPLPIYADNKTPLPKITRADYASRANDKKDAPDVARPAKLSEEKSGSRTVEKNAKPIARDEQKTKEKPSVKDDKPTAKNVSGDAKSTENTQDAVAQQNAPTGEDTQAAQAATPVGQDAVVAAGASQPVLLQNTVVPAGLLPEVADSIRALLAQTKDDLAAAVASNDKAAEKNIIQAFFTQFQQLMTENTATVQQTAQAPSTLTQAVTTGLTAQAAAPVIAADPASTAIPTASAAKFIIAATTQQAQLSTDKPVILAQPDAGTLLPEEIKKQLSAQVEIAKETLPELASANAAVVDNAKDSLIKQLHAVAALIEATMPAPVVNNTAKPVVQAAQNLLQALAPISANEGSQSQSSAGQEKGNDQTPSSPLFGIRSGSSPLSADNTHDANFSRVLSQAAKDPVLEQVAINIKNMVKDGSSKISIQLDPAQLGKLEIKLHVASDGTTNVSVLADNKDTFDMLRRDSAGLERALADAGLKTDSGSLSFNLRGGQQEQGKEHSLASSQYQKAIPEEEELPINVINRSYVVNLAEGLDIKI